MTGAYFIRFKHSQVLASHTPTVPSLLALYTCTPRKHSGACLSATVHESKAQAAIRSSIASDSEGYLCPIDRKSSRVHI